jgi:UDP-N-acetylmuramoylalanine--D-glutamate ligase
MTIAELQTKKKIVLLGYGKEGQATERFLRVHAPQAEIIIADQSREAGYLAQQTEGDLVIKTPGISKRFMTVPYTTATNIFFANTQRPIIGVTGSKGKSTTSALIAAFLQAGGIRARLVGNIGLPALEVFDEETEIDLYVMELSSYQLDDLEYGPKVAVFTSFFPEHLDYHGSLEAYFEAKANIVRKGNKDQVFIYNADYPELQELVADAPGIAVPFVESVPFSLAGLRLRGAHNLQNLYGAWTVAERFGVTPAQAEQAIRDFQPLPHRLTEVGTFRGITFIDDAISTAPEAAIQALQAIPRVETLFLGGTDRGYVFDELARMIDLSDVRNIVLFPDTGLQIKAALERHSRRTFAFLETESMEEAVRFAYEHTSAGMTCLLSTASPSYRLWKNFEHKGEDFTNWVKELGKN